MGNFIDTFAPRAKHLQKFAGNFLMFPNLPSEAEAALAAPTSCRYF